MAPNLLFNNFIEGHSNPHMFMPAHNNNLLVLSFGEILWDIIATQKFLGGAPLNFAAHAVKCGGMATLVSAVGNDELGNIALQRINTLHINTAFVQRCHEKPTATVDVFLSAGQPDYTIHEHVAFDNIRQEGLTKLATEPYNTFYFGSLAQRSAVNRATLKWILTHHTFDHIFYDINLRKNYYSYNIIKYSLEQCTILKINDNEVNIISSLLYGNVLSFTEFASRIRHDFNISLVIITAGKNGCYVTLPDALHHLPGMPVTVVDAVGAGDAFSAAFMYEYVRTQNIIKAATLANKIGAYVAAAQGAIPEYTDEIMNFIV